MNKDKRIGRVMAGCLRLHRYITLPPKARCAHRAIILCGALTALGPGNLAAAEWQPVKNVEIVVPASAGGSVDKTARFVQRLWQHHRLTEFTGIVVNKPGGAGTVALNYLNQHAGDAHFLEIVSATLLSQHITGQSALSHRDVTPLAQLFGEYYVLAVRPDSPFKTGRDVIGPRGMERRQIAYWDSVFGKVVALPEWKQELDRNLWENTYMNSSDTKEFVESEYRDTRAILLELGLAK